MGNLKVVVINGQGGVGKDLFVNYCNDFYDYLYSYSTVEFIKHAARRFGWRETKEPKEPKTPKKNGWGLGFFKEWFEGVTRDPEDDNNKEEQDNNNDNQ